MNIVEELIENEGLFTEFERGSRKWEPRFLLFDGDTFGGILSLKRETKLTQCFINLLKFVYYEGGHIYYSTICAGYGEVKGTDGADIRRSILLAIITAKHTIANTPSIYNYVIGGKICKAANEIVTSDWYGWLNNSNKPIPSDPLAYYDFLTKAGLTLVES